MPEQATHEVPRLNALISAFFLGCTLLGASVAQAQEPLSPGETDSAAQSGASMRGIEKSDIRRGHTHDADVDGDGLGDAAPVARRADLKKLADELVNNQDTDGSGDRGAAAKVDAGNALNAGSMNDRAGDPIPGIDITVNQGPPLPLAGAAPANEGAGAPAAAAERKKMKRLEATHTEPLELMDETDTCPTLPCP